MRPYLHFRLIIGVVALLLSASASSALAQAGSPWFTKHPVLQTVAPGGTATFTTAATGATSISYQWLKNGEILEGETDTSLVIENVQTTDQGGYSVLIKAGSYEFESFVAPLVINREVGWRWTHRVGSTGNDSALSLASGINTVWVGGEHNGQFIRRLNPATGAQVTNHQISTNGDGASAVCTDGAGRIMVGANLEITEPYSRPGLLQLRQGTSATVLWSRALATEKGGSDAPNGYADTTAVCPDGLGNVLAAGYFVGRGKFGTLAAGVIGNTSVCGFLVKYNDDGTPLWVRDVRSNDDEDDCRINDMAVDGNGDIYVSGVLGINGRLQRSATATDRTVSLANTFRRPFVAKYSNAGAHQWTYSPEQAGEFLSVAADAAGNIWATGYVGPENDITSRGGLLYRLNRLTGAMIEFKEVDEVTGCSIRTQGLNAFWLVLDATGNSKIGGVTWGTTGYRGFLLPNLTINLDNPTWEAPAFGGVGARSDEAEAMIAADGSISVALNFTQNLGDNSIRFPRRAALSLAGRARDGVVAQIGELPVINADPASKIVAVGAEVAMAVTVGGTQISAIQWLKNAKPITGKTTNSLTFESAKLTDSGAYVAKVSKGGNVVDSGTAEVAVVSTTLPNATQPAGKSITLTCTASGPNLSYQWLKNGNPLNGDTRIRGVITKTLVLSDLVAPDSASYTCRVTATGGSLTTNPSVVTVVLPPVIQEFALDPSMISAGVDFTPTSFNTPTRFTVTGLPPGMSFNATTGRIFGKPARAGNYSIRITATNMAGTVSRSASLVVNPLPSSVVGKHVGGVNIGLPNDNNFRLGGRLDVVVTGTGSYTGSIRLGSESIPLVGSLNIAPNPPYNPTIWITLPRAGRDTLTFSLSLRDTSESDGLLTAIGGNQVSVQGWREARSLAGFVGNYNASIAPNSANTSGPQGHGLVGISVSSTGATTATGRLADDTAFTTTACVGPNGQLLIYNSLYSHGGVVLGVLDITEDVASTYRNNTVSGQVAWGRAQVLASRFSPASFAPVTLTAAGSRYAPPTAIVMELPAAVNNAALKLSSGGLSSDLNLLFSITPTNIPVLPTTNPSLINIKLDPRTGRFSGSASITTADPYNPGLPLTRLAPYQGIIHRNATGLLEGFGYFVLNQLPDANANPPTTINTSASLSGSVRLSRNPPVVP